MTRILAVCLSVDKIIPVMQVTMTCLEIVTHMAHARFVFHYVDIDVSVSMSCLPIKQAKLHLLHSPG